MFMMAAKANDIHHLRAAALFTDIFLCDCIANFLS
jgi:hypothetical protein